jgi:hypothetical protein
MILCQWQVVPDVSKDHGTFVFRVMPSKENAHPVKHHHIPENFDIYQHCCEDLKTLK